MIKKDRNNVIEEYKSKIKILKKHNNLYHNNDAPIINDSEYDNLKKELLDLEKKYSFLRKIEKISNIVGAPTLSKFEKIKHLKPMLSLANAFEKKNMKDFLSKISNFLNLKIHQ